MFTGCTSLISLLEISKLNIENANDIEICFINVHH